MRVLLVHKFWRKVGGAEEYFQDVARILRMNGHHVKIYTTDFDADGSRDVYSRDANVVFGYAPDYLKGNVFRRILNIPETIYSKKNKSAFKKLLHEFQPEIVHVFAIYVTITPSILDACREMGVPVVMSCNDYKHICPNYRMFHHGHICEDCKGGKFYNALLNNCCKHSLAVSAVSSVEAYSHAWMNVWKKNISAFLFESTFMMQKTEEFWGKGSVQMEFLGKPFNATLYQASTGDQGYILYVGRLSDEKGVDILIRAMKGNPDVPLKIVGSGNYDQTLEDLVTTLGLKNVQFLGSQFGKELDTLIENARFLVVPSIWYENFPYVMMEAFARGKAVIGSAIGGIPEYIVYDQTGYTYPPNDVSALSNLIRKLFENPEKAKQMGLNSKALADQQFTDEIFYRRLSAIYQKVKGKVIKKAEFSS